MDKQLRILLLEDSMEDVELIEYLLRKEGINFNSKIVDTREQYEIALKDFLPDVVISDHSLPQFNSMEALQIYEAHKEEQQLPSAFILVTGTVSEEFAVDIIQKGADDYILKDRLKRLPSAIQSALDKNRLKEEHRKVEEDKLQLLDILQKSLHEVFIFNPDTALFEYANEEALKNIGYSVEELRTMTPLDILENFNESTFKAILSNVEKSKKGRIFETYSIRKDKSKYPVQIHLQLIEQGNRKTFLANVLDITETKQEAQQKDLAIFIQNTFNESKNLQSSLKSVLKELCSIKNLPAAEFWAKNFDEREMTRHAYFDIEQKGPGAVGAVFSELTLKKKDTIFVQNLQKEQLDGIKNIPEEKRFQSLMSLPIELGNEILAVLILYSREKNEDKESFFKISKTVQHQLANNIKRKKTEEELSKIFELSPDAFVVAGLDGYFKKVNPFFKKSLGLSNQELLSTPIKELMHPDDWYILDEWEESHRKNIDLSHYENRYKTKDGDYKWFAWSVTPFLEQDLAFAVGKDITEQKEYLEAIKLQNNKLADIAWQQSHVVRGPLTRMMSCIQHMEESDEHKEELLEIVKSSAYELDEIVKAIVKKTEKIKKE